MSEKIPTVTILKPIAPSPESTREPILEYPNLEGAITKHQPFLHDRLGIFFAAEEGSLEERHAASQLAMHYMLLTAYKLHNNARVRGSWQLWSERYTQASSEI